MISSTLRDCSYGALILNESDAMFHNTVVRSCGEFDTLEIYDSSVLFDMCTFMENNGSGFLSCDYQSSIDFENCMLDEYEEYMLECLMNGELGEEYAEPYTNIIYAFG